MGYTIFLAAQVRLRPEVPMWVLDYLRGLVEGLGEGHEAHLPPGMEAWWTYLPGGGWFGEMSTDGSLQTLSGIPGEWTFRLQGEFHDDFVGQDWTLMGMLAAFAVDGPIGARWTDMGPEVDAFLARSGQLFVAALANPPAAVSPANSASVPRTSHCRAPRAEVLVQHGLPRSRAEALAGEDPGEAAMARYLLARSLWRAAVEDLDIAAIHSRLGPAGDDWAVLGRAAAEAAVEAVFGVLDAGFDERAGPNAPGWEVAETSRPITFGPGRTIRTIRGLQSMMDDLPGCDVSAGPTPLVAGLRVRVRETIAMTARSDVWVDAPSGGKSYHTLPLIVPAGAELTVTHVYPRGHAECTSPHWPLWIVGPVPGSAAAHYPTAPQAAPDRYQLSWIQPEYEGKDYTVIDDTKPER